VTDSDVNTWRPRWSSMGVAIGGDSTVEH
jgi:hypothetical protein